MKRIKSQEELETIVNTNRDEIFQLMQAIHKYHTTVQYYVSRRGVVLGELQGRFIQMRPSLHRECDNDRVIDVKALVYALQRLPEMVTRTGKVYVLKEPKITEVPGIVEVNSQVRRRAYYDVSGDLFTIAREGDTDILDFVNCLNSYSIEAQKIRGKLKEGNLITSKDLVEATTPEKKNKIYASLATIFGGAKAEEIKKADESIHGRLLPLIANMITHDPANMQLSFDSDFSVTNDSEKARLWNKAIAQALGPYGNRPIALISSDTHSMVNCLTGFALENSELIKKLASGNEKIAESTKGMDLSNPSVLYCLLQQVTHIPEGRELFKQKVDYEESLGMRFIRDKFDTSVDVQIIDVPALLKNPPKNIDPRLKFDMKKAADSGLLLLNMDYSFGAQGYFNMSGLCENLGRNIKSVSIMGKAGITRLNGQRFEIMLPDYVVEQADRSIIHDFPNGNSLTGADFEGIFSGVIHNSGPMLTVPGTAMQSDLLLYHFMHRYNVLGVEMEAGPYVEALKNAHKIGKLNKDVMINVGYWSSDNPLNPDETLAENHMVRGAIPSYALAIATLNRIFRNGSQ